MSKYEEAIQRKAQLVGFEKYARTVFGRIKLELTKNTLPDGGVVEHQPKDEAVFNKILEALRKLEPQIIAQVVEDERAEVAVATAAAWEEMSELFKDYGFSLAEIKELADKVPAAMP